MPKKEDIMTLRNTIKSIRTTAKTLCVAIASIHVAGVVEP